MHLDIITPDQRVFQGEAVSVTFPGLDGSFEVLNHHAPLIGVLKAGPVVVRPTGGGTPTTFQLDGGIVEVLNNNVVVLAEALLA